MAVQQRFLNPADDVDLAAHSDLSTANTDVVTETQTFWRKRKASNKFIGAVQQLQDGIGGGERIRR